MVVWVCRHAVVVSRKVLVRKGNYKKLDQFWRNVRAQLDFLSSGSCGYSTEVVQKNHDRWEGIVKEGYKRIRSEEFCRSDGGKNGFLSLECISFPFPCFLLCLNFSKSYSWSVPLLNFIVDFLSPSPKCDLALIYCPMSYHTVHLWPRYGGGFSCSCQSSNCWEVRKKGVRNALMQLLNSVPYLWKLLSEPEAKTAVNSPLFLLILFFQEMPHLLGIYPHSPGCCNLEGKVSLLPLQSDMNCRHEYLSTLLLFSEVVLKLHWTKSFEGLFSFIPNSAHISWHISWTQKWDTASSPLA